MNPQQQAVTRALAALGIPYHVIEHAPAYTMQDCQAVDAQIDAAHCKNLFLCNRQRTRFYMLCLRADKRFRTAQISRQLQEARLSFADEEALLRLLGLTPGAVGPLALVHPAAHAVTLVMDEDLRHAENLAFHPNVNTATVVLAAADFFSKFLPHTGHTPVFVHIEAEPEPPAED